MKDNKTKCVVSDRDSIPSEEVVDIIDMTGDADDSDDSAALTTTFSSNSVPVDVDADSARKTTPLIFNGKYFKIITKIKNTAQDREAIGILASCQLCTRMKIIKASSLKASNFIRHLKLKHIPQYKEYVKERQNERKKFSKKGVKERSSTLKPIKPTDVSSEKPALILNGEYFKIIKRTDHHKNPGGGIIAACQLCTNNTKLKGYSGTMSNFVKHLKLKHPAIFYKKYLIQKQIEGRRPAKRCKRPSKYASGSVRPFSKISGADSKGDRGPSSSSVVGKQLQSSTFSANSTHSVGPTKADCDREALIFNGEYFKISRKIDSTGNERSAKSIIAVCQICKPIKNIKGSLKITSKLVQHLRKEHPERYESYMNKKAGKAKKCSANEQQSDNGPSSSSINKCSRSSLSFLSTNTDLNRWKNVNIIFNGEFFSIIKKLEHTPRQKEKGGIIAVCQLCKPPKRLRGYLLIRTNFITHLKKTHPAHYKLYLKKNNTKKKDRVGELSSRSKHSILPDVHADPDKNKTKKQDNVQSVNLHNFNEKLLAFLVDSFSPLSMVGDPSFRSLFGDDNSLKVCSQRYVAHLMQTKYTQLKENIKDCLKNVPYVCTMADIWCGSNIFYFLYTCHWIDSSLNRQSAALACRNFNINQLKQITEIIHVLNTDFGLDKEKVVCTITGNSHDFLKEFKEFGIKGEATDADSDDGNKVESDQPGFSPRLKRQYKCGSQNLMEFATIDFTNVLKANRTIHEIHATSLRRCYSIWDKCDSPEAVNNNLLRHELKTPNSTCWNSLFDSLKSLIECKSELDDICSALGVPKFITTEVLYIEEYYLLMEPISDALEFLQNEKDIYYGYFLPILVSTKVKLHKLHKFGNLTHLKDVAKEMEIALVKRFRKFFEISPDCYDSVISAIACPSIKMRFTKPLRETSKNASLENLKLLFIRHAEEFQEEVELAAMPSRTGIASVKDFFDFDETSEDTLMAVRNQVERYLVDEDCSLDCVRKYPIIKKMFIKYNTPLPSSSPVERLLSFEGIVNRQRRQHLSAEHFERVVIMGANKMFDFN